MRNLDEYHRMKRAFDQVNVKADTARWEQEGFGKYKAPKVTSKIARHNRGNRIEVYQNGCLWRWRNQIAKLMKSGRKP